MSAWPAIDGEVASCLREDGWMVIDHVKYGFVGSGRL
jgi:hypothetical protein